MANGLLRTGAKSYSLMKPLSDCLGHLEKGLSGEEKALVRRAEDVIHTLAETVPLSDRTTRESWLDNLSRLKDKLSSTVQNHLHTLRGVLDYHHTCDRLKLWYGQVLSESLLQELLWTGHCEGDTGSSWRPRVESFTRRSPCPQVEELVKLAQLSNIMTEASFQTTGTQLAHRCMTLRRILTAPGAVPLQDLQLALQWQYEYLKGHRSTSDLLTSDLPGSTQCESLTDLSKWPSVSSTHPAAKPASLSSFDSGFDGAGGSLLDIRNKRDMPGYLGNGDTALKWSPLNGQIHEEIVVSVSDSEDQREEPGFELKRDSAHASIRIVPKVNLDSVNLEIKVKRSATLPTNPWLSLPIEELESCYTVSITPSSSFNNRSPSLSERWQDQRTQTHHTHEESLQESGLSPSANVLSSTLTDPEDRPVDGDPSLQWDTFDLHNLRQDSLERLDESVGDWLQREQDQLEEVQETLERAAGIIQEEEQVLAQEVVLDELLRSEDLHRHWPLWTDGRQYSKVSSRDLSESGVIGLDVEGLHNEKTRAGDVVDGIEGVSACERSAQLDTERPHVDRSGILRELEDLQLLEEQIMEECLKLEELRQTEPEDLLRNRAFSEEPERNRSSELEKPGIMEKSSKWRDVDEDLLSSPEPADTEKTDSPNVLNADECSLHGASEQDLSSELSSSDLRSPASVSCSELLLHSPSHHTEPLNSLSGSPTLSQMMEDMDSIVSETEHPPLVESPSCKAAVEAQVYNAPSTLQNSDVRSEFDPGGIPNPAPRRTLFLPDRHCPPSSTEYTQVLEESGLPCSTSESTNVEESAQSRPPGLHMQNNNNNTAVEKLIEETQRPGYCRDSSRTELMAGGFTRVCSSALQQQINTPSRQMSDYKTPIILDSGSGLMKAGFADQDLPAAVFPSVIGRPKYEEVMSSWLDRELYVGHDAQHMRGVLTLKYPIRHGVVNNWDDMEKIWSHAFQLLSAAPEDHPVLLTEAARNPLQNRQRMVELMFETFSVPLTFVAVQAVLALYASGRTTGVVLDSGDGVSHSVPVFEGYCLPHAIQRLDLAGADVTLQLQKLLLERAVCLRTSAELEIVREMKERCCFVSLDYEAEQKSSGPETHYTLPDGRIVSLDSECFRAPEILFRPELIGRDHYGMHESVFRSVLQSDLDLRRSFVGNIILSGGNTLLSGLAERLQLEIRRMVPADLSMCVRVTSPPDRDFSVWSGGAALANLPDHQSAWISAEEYEEFGPQIVFRKCF